MWDPRSIHFLIFCYSLEGFHESYRLWEPGILERLCEITQFPLKQKMFYLPYWNWLTFGQGWMLIFTYTTVYLALHHCYYWGVCSFLPRYISFEIVTELCYLPEGTIFFSSPFQKEEPYGHLRWSRVYKKLFHKRPALRTWMTAFSQRFLYKIHL
jgi:hypothetical protein